MSHRCKKGTHGTSSKSLRDCTYNHIGFLWIMILKHEVTGDFKIYSFEQDLLMKIASHKHKMKMVNVHANGKGKGEFSFPLHKVGCRI